MIEILLLWLLVVGGDQQERRAQQGGHGEAHKKGFAIVAWSQKDPEKEKETQTMSLQI